MTSSIITTKDFESTHNPSEVLKPTEYLEHQQTPVDKNSTGTAIDSPEASLGRKREEIDTSHYGKDAGESNNSTRSPGHIDTNTSLSAPENTKPVSIKLDEGGKGKNGPGEEDEDDSEDDSEEDDSDDGFPIFEGGEPRGRPVPPVSGTRPPRPKPK